jgi:hypothetical protein
MTPHLTPQRLSRLDAWQRTTLLHLLLGCEQSCRSTAVTLLLSGRLKPALRSASRPDALLTRSLGLGAWDSGNFDEAASSLYFSTELFAEIEDISETAASRSLLGLLLSENADPRHAIAALDSAVFDVDRARWPWLSVFGLLSLALAHARLDEAPTALRTRHAASLLYGKLAAPEDVLRVHWLEARIAAALGAARAEDDFHQVIERLLRSGQTAAAFLAGLDLAVFLAEIARLERLGRVQALLEDGSESREDTRYFVARIRELALLSPAEAAREAAELASRFPATLRFDFLRIAGEPPAPAVARDRPPLRFPDTPAGRLLRRLSDRKEPLRELLEKLGYGEDH